MAPRPPWLLLPLVAAACAPEPGAAVADTAAPVLDPGMTLGEPVRCAAPASGVDGLRDIAAEAGVTEPLPDTMSVFERDVPGTGGGVAIADLDIDGDLDLLIGGLDGAPDLYVNDGGARFTRRTLELPGATGAHAIHVADMDGDGWPDLVVFGAREGGGVYRNVGGLAFERAASFRTTPGISHAVVMTGLVGDLDGDGDLDIAVPTMGLSRAGSGDGAREGAADVLLLQDAPLEFSFGASLVGPAGETLSQVGWLSDRDEDGDLDLWVLPDQGPQAAWWRNDGALPSEEDAEAVGGAVQMAAMGLDSADLDGDGRMDVCISDVGTPRCLLGQADGTFVDASAITQLPVDDPLDYGPDGAFPTIGWSIALVDLDADGHLDLLQASGPEEGAWAQGYRDIGDMLWWGRGELTWEDHAAAAGFWDEAAHVGLATGDLDGDGFLEVVRAGPGVAPELHSMPCTDGAWLQVRVAGAAVDPMGFGTRITVEAGGRVWREEVLGLRDKAQGAPWQTFGLGDVDRADRVVVRWLDGTEQIAEDVPLRRVLEVAHPDAVAPAPYPAE